MNSGLLHERMSYVETAVLGKQQEGLIVNRIERLEFELGITNGTNNDQNSNPTKWRVSWNKELNEKNPLNVGDEFSQPKGAAKMIVLPSKGYLVGIVCGGKCIYEGKIISDGFLDVGFSGRGGNLEVAIIKITNIPLNPVYLNAVCRTWSKYPIE